MKDVEQDDRLPKSIGGLIGFAVAAYVERAPLYLALALLAFAIDGIVQLLAPDKIPFMIAAQVVGDALLIGAVALGVGTRAAGATASSKKLIEAAVIRWGDVAGATGIATVIADFIVVPVAFLAGGGGPIAYVSAPMAWLLLGALGLAGPVTALGNDRPILAILTGFWRALALGLRLVNLPRLIVICAAVGAVSLLDLAIDIVLRQRGLPHREFWANVPLDALLTGPLTALQAAFSLDFARRLRATAAPRS